MESWRTDHRAHALQPGHDRRRHSTTVAPVSAASHFAAGSLAGLSADLLVYPLDSLATHAQSRSRASSFRALYRGFGVAAALSAPAYAAYFGTYDLSKQLGLHPAFGGCIAEVAGGLFFVPCEVLKKRAQLGRSGYTQLRRVPHTATALVRAEGARALYAGYGASVAAWMPFSAVYFWSFEIFRSRILHGSRLRDFCKRRTGWRLLPRLLRLLWTSFATRVQTRYAGGEVCLFRLFRGIVREEGAGGCDRFSGGAQARVAWLAPQAAVTLSVFEFLKRWFDGECVSFRREV